MPTIVDWTPARPMVLDTVLDDPSLVPRLLAANAPYWPVQRYFASTAEMNALSRTSQMTGNTMVVGPVFRGDWADSEPLVDGVEPILHNPRFVDAARRCLDGTVVRPILVYANLSLPMLCGDGGHTDVPAFRGIDRRHYPIWLLTTMGRSRLFERWRVRIATAVSWYYTGAAGDFTYWPDGPDAKPIVRPPQWNTAVMGDNDFMFHRVESIGGAGDHMLRGLTLDAQLCHTDAGWAVVDAGRTLATYPAAMVRVSVSWKGQVFANAEGARVYDEHLDDLDFARVLATLRDDLATRGIGLPETDDPLHDASFVATVSRAYHRSPTVYPWGSV
jgi:hypothetical protein